MRLLPGELTIGPGGVGDARFVADVTTAEFPDEPLDPAVIAHWYSAPETVWGRFLAYSDGQRVGYAASEHHPWEMADDGFVWFYAGLLPGHRSVPNFDVLYGHLEEGARADSGRAGLAEVREDDNLMLETLAARGYLEERRERFWELDLESGRGRLLEMAERSRVRMREQGVIVTSLAADADPEKYRKFYEVSSASEYDVPMTDTPLPDSFERTMEWLESPFIHQDRVWIARLDDQVVGLSTLKFPVERGIVATDWTCVGRAHRGRGIARALKLETVVQAIELGVDRVRTDNDFRNAPILHLNEDLGYRHVFDRVQLKKTLVS